MTAPGCLWPPPPADVLLSRGDVHVWCASLDHEASQLQKLRRTLASDELSRADRFYFQGDRERFIAARGVLRAILSLYLDTAPDQLRFCYGSRGKPSLAITPGQDNLRFNLSHAGGLVLYAVTNGREIGIDLELLRPIPDAEQIAERFFSSRENTALLSVPPGQRHEAFFNCWTRKEAYVKAVGDGLARPLDGFDVSLKPGEPARLLSVEGDPRETLRWCLREVTPAPDYIAAVAVEGQGWHLACWHWPAAHCESFD